jgi:heme A synthase
MSDLVLFGLLIFFAYRARSRAEAHKRLILIPTLTLLDAAIGRWPIALLQQRPPLQDLVLFGFVLLVVLYELLSLHRVSRTTLRASAMVVAVHLTRVPLGKPGAWHWFASWVIGKAE